MCSRTVSDSAVYGVMPLFLANFYYDYQLRSSDGSAARTTFKDFWGCRHSCAGHQMVTASPVAPGSLSRSWSSDRGPSRSCCASKTESCSPDGASSVDSWPAAGGPLASDG